MLIEYYIYDFSGVKLFSKSFKTFQKAFDFCLNNFDTHALSAIVNNLLLIPSSRNTNF